MPAIIRKIMTIGNSKGIIIPTTLLELLGWTLDTPLEIRLDGKKLVISAARVASDEKKSKKS